MAVTELIRDIKQVHPNDIIMVKIGKFYHVYGKDAYIISYIFNYQLRKVETNMYNAGFPEVALNKVLKTLEDKKINYVIVDRGANYEVVDNLNFKQDNKYSDAYIMASKFITRKKKIDEIYEYLVSNVNDDLVKEQIQRIEDILYERR